MQATDGNFYGTTAMAAPDSLLRLWHGLQNYPKGALTTLHSFDE